jgi:hypothetical protein
MFSAQEILIAFFYVHAAYQYLQSRFNTTKSKVRSAVCLLLLIQVIIIALDITIIVLDLAGYLKLKVIIHSFVYSVKLELEFVVLNQLIEISRIGSLGNLSVSHAVVDPQMRATGKEVIDRPALPSWSTSRGSDVDLEACESHASDITFDFIPKPRDL